MDINFLLKGVECECGRKHVCDIKHVYIENKSHLRLPELCAEHEEIVVVADENTYGACGSDVMSTLEGKKVKKVIFTGAKVLVPNEEAVDEVTKNLGKATLIIGIGSGVIQDLCKYVAFENNMPYFIVATAPSMDGYTSSGAAMILGGMKVTHASRVPEVILASPEVLANAPLEMIKAGYGDIVGKYSALNDWKLGKAVFDEYFCQYNYDLTMDMLKKTLELSEGLLKRNEESMKALMEALIVVGIAMSFVGNSRPASGSEHHLSHFFEIVGIARGEDYFPHGIDVVYSAVITQMLRDRILALPDFKRKQFEIPREAYVKRMKEVYGYAAEGCIALQDKLNRYNQDRVSVYIEKEDEIRAILKEAPSTEEMMELLAKMEMNMKDFYDLYSKEKITEAVFWAKELKDRYTVLWIYFDLFGVQE